MASTKEKAQPATLQECKNLGEVCDFIKANYDQEQEMSTGGKSILAAYLKSAKPAK